MDQYLKTSEWVKPRQKQILMGLGAVVAIIALVLVYQWVSGNNEEKAGNAFANAMKIDAAQVGDPLPVVQPGDYAFKSEDEKNRKAAEAFLKVAQDYPSRFGDVATYYAAVHQLEIDGGAKGEEALKSLAGKNSPVSSQARFVLAQRYLSQNKNQEGLAELKKLKEAPGTVSVPLIDLTIGQANEALGNKKEASDIYFNVASMAAERVTQVTSKALSLLTSLDPERVNALPEANKKGTIDTSKILTR